jgi:hypothetical protein
MAEMVASNGSDGSKEVETVERVCHGREARCSWGLDRSSEFEREKKEGPKALQTDGERSRERWVKI